ncbi:hypothetical protein M8J77_004343 [Diaphorina citri]|nr:hypothetical protein M8J77_004343 [Diaphorina citri]
MSPDSSYDQESSKPKSTHRVPQTSSLVVDRRNEKRHFKESAKVLREFLANDELPEADVRQMKELITKMERIVKRCEEEEREEE